jgi:hypothetical protein
VLTITVQMAPLKKTFTQELSFQKLCRSKRY